MPGQMLPKGAWRERAFVSARAIRQAHLRTHCTRDIPNNEEDRGNGSVTENEGVEDGSCLP